jgi:hypothetical protein
MFGCLLNAAAAMEPPLQCGSPICRLRATPKVKMQLLQVRQILDYDFSSLLRNDRCVVKAQLCQPGHVAKHIA